MGNRYLLRENHLQYLRDLLQLWLLEGLLSLGLFDDLYGVRLKEGQASAELGPG